MQDVLGVPAWSCKFVSCPDISRLCGHKTPGIYLKVLTFAIENSGNEVECIPHFSKKRETACVKWSFVWDSTVGLLQNIFCRRHHGRDFIFSDLFLWSHGSSNLTKQTVTFFLAKVCVALALWPISKTDLHMLIVRGFLLILLCPPSWRTIGGLFLFFFFTPFPSCNQEYSIYCQRSVGFSYEMKDRILSNYCVSS